MKELFAFAGITNYAYDSDDNNACQ